MSEQRAVMSPPRLTGALRSFSSVSKKEEETQQLYDLKVRHSHTCIVVGSLQKQWMTTMTLWKTFAATTFSSQQSIEVKLLNHTPLCVFFSFKNVRSNKEHDRTFCLNATTVKHRA